jgi:DNA-binding response OmpR family regulator
MKPRRKSRDSLAPAARVLVAEDEFLVSLLLEEELRSLGCSIVGPYKRLADAVAASRGEAFDFAILDVNLGGEMIYPLADELETRKVPFIFTSGYGSLSLPERFRTHVCLTKPYDGAALVNEINRLLACSEG